MSSLHLSLLLATVVAVAHVTIYSTYNGLLAKHEVKITEYLPSSFLCVFMFVLSICFCVCVHKHSKKE